MCWLSWFQSTELISKASKQLSLEATVEGGRKQLMEVGPHVGC